MIITAFYTYTCTVYVFFVKLFQTFGHTETGNSDHGDLFVRTTDAMKVLLVRSAIRRKLPGTETEISPQLFRLMVFFLSLLSLWGTRQLANWTTKQTRHLTNNTRLCGGTFQSLSSVNETRMKNLTMYAQIGQLACNTCGREEVPLRVNPAMYECVCLKTLPITLSAILAFQGNWIVPSAVMVLDTVRIRYEEMGVVPHEYGFKDFQLFSRHLLIIVLSFFPFLIFRLCLPSIYFDTKQREFFGFLGIYFLCGLVAFLSKLYVLLYLDIAFTVLAFIYWRQSFAWLAILGGTVLLSETYFYELLSQHILYIYFAIISWRLSSSRITHAYKICFQNDKKTIFISEFFESQVENQSQKSKKKTLVRMLVSALCRAIVPTLGTCSDETINKRNPSTDFEESDEFSAFDFSEIKRFYVSEVQTKLNEKPAIAPVSVMATILNRYLPRGVMYRSFTGTQSEMAISQIFTEISKFSCLKIWLLFDSDLYWQKCLSKYKDPEEILSNESGEHLFSSSISFSKPSITAYLVYAIVNVLKLFLIFIFAPPGFNSVFYRISYILASSVSCGFHFVSYYLLISVYLVLATPILYYYKRSQTPWFMLKTFFWYVIILDTSKFTNVLSLLAVNPKGTELDVAKYLLKHIWFPLIFISLAAIGLTELWESDKLTKIKTKLHGSKYVQVLSAILIKLTFWSLTFYWYRATTLPDIPNSYRFLDKSDPRIPDVLTGKSQLEKDLEAAGLPTDIKELDKIVNVLEELKRAVDKKHPELAPIENIEEPN